MQVNLNLNRGYSNNAIAMGNKVAQSTAKAIVKPLIAKNSQVTCIVNPDSLELIDLAMHHLFGKCNKAMMQDAKLLESAINCCTANGYEFNGSVVRSLQINGNPVTKIVRGREKAVLPKINLKQVTQYKDGKVWRIFQSNGAGGIDEMVPAYLRGGVPLSVMHK